MEHRPLGARNISYKRWERWSCAPDDNPGNITRELFFPPFDTPPSADYIDSPLLPQNALCQSGSRVFIAADEDWEAGENPALPRNCKRHC
jgi:hypothetical protein